MAFRDRRMRWAAAWAALLCAVAAPRGEAAVRGLRAFSSGGLSYVRLGDLAAFYGLEISETAAGRVVLSSKYHSMVFVGDSRVSSLLGVQVWLQQPLTRLGGRWCVSKADAERLIDPVLRTRAFLSTRRAASVVLDPGHGGEDAGAIGPRGVREKNLTLDLAVRVRDRLAREGLRVGLTRTADRAADLDARARTAARFGADLFVSLHFNASTDASVNGIETYVLSKAGYPSTNARDQRPSARYTALTANAHDAASSVLGFQLHKAVVRGAGLDDRGLRHARFQVLRSAPCPAVLVECGYLSNRTHERRLSDAAYRDQLARAIAQGIVAYVQEVRRARLSGP